MTTFVWDTRPTLEPRLVTPVLALLRYRARTRSVPAADVNGHRTRYSDASSYDEVCLTCGATDARSPNDPLSAPCPLAVPADVAHYLRLGRYDELLLCTEV